MLKGFLILQKHTSTFKVTGNTKILQGIWKSSLAYVLLTSKIEQRFWQAFKMRRNPWPYERQQLKSTLPIWWRLQLRIEIIIMNFYLHTNIWGFQDSDFQYGFCFVGVELIAISLTTDKVIYL